MPRPFIEAAALLAAQGFCALPPARGSVFSSRSIVLPITPSGSAARFAFLPRIDAVTKPFVFDDLPALARHIERQRQGQTMQLEDVEHLEFAGSPDLHHGVQVWALDMAGDRDRSLGYAWLDGRGRETLEGALRAARKSRPIGTPLSQLSGRPGHPGLDRFSAIASSWGYD